MAGGVIGSLANGLEQIGLHAGGGVWSAESREDVVAGGVVTTQADFPPGIVAQPDGRAALETQRAAAATGTGVGVEAPFKPELSLIAAAQIFLAAKSDQAGLTLAGVQRIEPVAASFGTGNTNIHHTKDSDGRLCKRHA